MTTEEHREQRFDIEGMTCAACVRRVEQRVSGMEGVEAVVVNLATERMAVRFDPEQVDEAGIAAVLDRAGYGARLRAAAEVVLSIGGMTCAACSRRVERRLQKVDGVQSAAVNLATEEARVAYEGTRLRDLKAAVVAAGYAVRREYATDARQARKEIELAEQASALRPAFLFWLPLFGVEMGGMAGLPIPDFLSFSLHPINL